VKERKKKNTHNKEMIILLI